MTSITIELPDDLAERANRVGVLSNPLVLALIEEATRHAAAQKLRQAWTEMDAADGSVMSQDDIAECIKAVRASHRS
jgi:predicted transcriptional regulator